MMQSQQGQLVIAPSVNRAPAVLVLGLGLIVANAATHPAWRNVGRTALGLSPLNLSGVTDPEALTLENAAFQLAMVIALAWIASSSNPTAGSLALAVVVGMWAVWLVRKADLMSALFSRL